MSHAEFAQLILTELARPPSTLPAIAIDETRRNNAGRCMTALICHRLSQGAMPPKHIRHTTFSWNDGVFTVRNARITDHHWSTYQINVGQQLHEDAQRRAVAYLLTYWALDEGLLHVWAVPEDVAFGAFAELPTHARTDCKTVEVSPEDHRLQNAPSSPSFADYYTTFELTELELNKLAQAIKTDASIKLDRLAQEETTTVGDTESVASGFDNSLDVEQDDEVLPGYTEQTVAFLQELPKHINDGSWHEQNKRRYEAVLRDPSQAVVDELATTYMQRLNPAVAGGKRHLSILKKNDYGKGGYHDHFWFAFYDPASGSKTKSVQLFVRFLGGERVWRYGLCMGNYCGQYMERLLKAIGERPQAVASYLRRAPAESIVRLFVGESEHEMTPAEFAIRIEENSDGTMGLGDSPSSILIVREYPLATLPDHSDSFVEEVGDYFKWAWPFFDASLSGAWQTVESAGPKAAIVEQDVADVDESAPQTIDELAELTALPADFLTELEEALSAKQQAILVGPPGTSKTYIARQFARYFVRQRQGLRPQGSFDALFMHANWGYEDFFEGLKPTSNSGSLTFEPRLGYFLEWIEQLKEFDPRTLHVLILDEINRCDTAAVLGELLQLLEYRGTTVRLLSGRSFVFPENVYLIGTMNSADRSIGRMDLALRRRFMWLNLYPRPDTLQKWLNRRGNNVIGFEGADLKRCNELLAENDIPAEQQIGHALFMLQGIDGDDQASPRLAAS